MRGAAGDGRHRHRQKGDAPEQPRGLASLAAAPYQPPAEPHTERTQQIVGEHRCRLGDAHGLCGKIEVGAAHARMNPDLQETPPCRPIRDAG
jgi:hypothetical protein